MIVAIVFCASILSSRPGCTVESVRLVVDVTPMGCAAKAQAVAAERQPMHVGETVASFGCRRDRRQEAEARP